MKNIPHLERAITGKPLKKKILSALFVLMMFLPVMVASGLAWLPVMLSASRGGFDGKLGAVTMSPLAAAALYALYVSYQGGGHDLAKPIAWGAMIFFAPMIFTATTTRIFTKRF